MGLCRRKFGVFAMKRAARKREIFVCMGNEFAEMKHTFRFFEIVTRSSLRVASRARVAQRTLREKEGKY